MKCDIRKYFPSINHEILIDLLEEVGFSDDEMWLIKKLIKEQPDNATIGLLLCKNKDNFTAEYALRNISSPIGVSEYKLLEDMPEYLQSQLPKAEDIELHIKAMEDIEKQETQEEIN